jgi:hypothetical protein
MKRNRAIFFQAEVLDNQDPLMLGRVRARILIDNYEDIIKGITSPPWNEEKDKWGPRDPFIFGPLIPYFLYQVPSNKELIQVIYVNKDFEFQNQYYIQSNFSTPTATKFEYYQGGNKFTGTGIQLKSSKPLKNSDGTYTDQAIHKGVFPEPGDNALLGRGSSDVVVKENEILVRSGKFKGSTLQPNILPAANNKRGFLQLSRFNSSKIPGPDKIVTEIKEEIVLVKHLIEWVITNPENTQDKFTGAVYLYKLKSDESVNSKNLTVDTVVKETLKSLVASESFINKTKKETINFINDFIIRCNSTAPNYTRSGNILFTDLNNKFPIFYRPNNLTFNVLKSSSPKTQSSNQSLKNVSDIFNGVKLLPALKVSGYGLIYAQNSVGTPINLKSSNVPQSVYLESQSTYGALGSDYLYLLSHNSSIPGKGTINFDDTLYGINLEQFVDEILPKTSSSVRGEELLELINLIVRFLVTHTHAYPGLAPITVTQDGSNVQDILTELQNASTKILNNYIRLN